MFSSSDILESHASIDKWKRIVFDDFQSSITNKNRKFPCVFGANSFSNDLLRFSFYDDLDAESLSINLKNI